ncbi:PAS domain-containing protein [Candidatus Saccharibacteria bacterium]|nr:PAS domain-containing protein [Candidatus Saccharibacteria bacterium]
MSNLPTDKIISCFYDSSTDCVKVLGTDGALLSFNPAGLKVMEIDDPKEVIGKDWLSFWEGNMHQKAVEALATATKGTIAGFEGYCPTYKGTMKYWEVTIAPLLNDFGQVQWLLVTSRDMTKYRDMEDELVFLRQELTELKASLA